MHVTDIRWIPCEKRLDIAGLPHGDDEIDPVPRDIHPRELLHHFLHLGHNDSLLEMGGLDDGGCVFGVGAGVKVSVLVRLDADHECDLGGQIEEIAGKQLQVSMDFTNLQLPDVDQTRHLPGLGSGERKIDFCRDSAFKELTVGRKGDCRLDHMQSVDFCRVDLAETVGEEIGLLLIVALQTHPIPRVDDGLKEGRRPGRIDNLAVSPLGQRFGLGGTCFIFPFATCPVFSGMNRCCSHRIASENKKIVL